MLTKSLEVMRFNTKPTKPFLMKTEMVVQLRSVAIKPVITLNYRAQKIKPSLNSFTKKMAGNPAQSGTGEVISCVVHKRLDMDEKVDSGENETQIKPIFFILAAGSIVLTDSDEDVEAQDEATREDVGRDDENNQADTSSISRKRASLLFGSLRKNWAKIR